MVDSVARSHREYRFGDLRFIPDRQLLLHRGTPLPLGSRAMGLLHLLVMRAGEVVTRQDLMNHVWPDTHLHESNLKVNISTLRRALPHGPSNPEYVATVPGRGYRFVVPVQVVDAPVDFRLDALLSPSGELPAIPEVIGRSAVISEVAAMLIADGLVTIVGPAGVGKTTIAVAAARDLAGRFADGVRFVDLAAIDEPDLVVPAIGMALGIDSDITVGLSLLVDALRGKQVLLLLDNCEHVLNATATIAEHLRRTIPEIAILATSRETLRTRAETVLQLAPFAWPDPDTTGSAAHAMTFPAIALFVGRAEAAHGYRLTDADAPIVAAICRRLDGIALAIELAVPKLADCNPAALLALLEHSFEPLNLGAPTGIARHQTLLATLGWSYRLLSRDEARLFRTVSVFPGSFGFSDIVGVARGDHIQAAQLAAWTNSLVAKSLVTATYRTGAPRYRLLDSTRSFAAAQLQAHDETDAVCARYAHYLLAVLLRAEAEWAWRDRKDWTDDYAAHANDVRKAIDWALNGHGDFALGIRLTVAAIPLWDELSAVGESHLRVERALRVWDTSGLADRVLRMKLIVSYGAALNFSDHLGPDADAAWDEGYRLAKALGNADYKLRALWGQAVLQSYSGRHRLALVTLHRFMDVADRENDRAAMPDGRRLMLMTGFYLGDIRAAQTGLTALEREHAVPTGQSRIARFQVDRLVGIRVGLGVVTWLRGDHAGAMAIAQSALDRAAYLSHRVSQSNALAQMALPLSFYIGDWALARQHVATLDYNLSLRETGIWRPVCRFWRAAIDGAAHDAGAVDAMVAAIGALLANNFMIRVPLFQTVLGEVALGFGRIDVARRAAAEAMACVTHQAEYWILPEVLRLQGLIAQARLDFAVAEHAFGEAADLAVASGALTLQLRATTSLAELLIARDRRGEAAAQLAPVFARFDPVLPSRDITKARHVLDRCAV